MEFKLNKDGQKRFEKQRKLYVQTIKDLCVVNNIDVLYFEDEKGAELCLTTKDNKGIYISSDYNYPFFLDYDEDLEFSKDFPSTAEALCRIWNLKHLIDFGQPYNRKRVMDEDAIKREKSLIKLDFSNELIKRSEGQFHDDYRQIRDKSSLVLAYTIIKQACGEDRELLNAMKDVIKDGYIKEDKNENVSFVLDWAKNIAETAKLEETELS